MPPTPEASLIVREHNGSPFYEAKFRYDGRQIKRRIGPAWLERNADGSWRRRRGRVADECFDERRAHATAAALVNEYIKAATEDADQARKRAGAGVSFREVAAAYVQWLREIRGAKPATLRDHGYILAEPGTPYKRGRGELLGHVMLALGSRPARAITTREVEALLDTVASTGASARAVNKTRNIVSAAFNFGMRESAFALPRNPAAEADLRREKQPGILLYYAPNEVEEIADALARGVRRDAVSRRLDQRLLDEQDGELVRVAAYTGLRLGELLALRWRDVDFTGSVITVSRALSAGIETTTKSGRVRRVPLPTQASDALTRLRLRPDFVAADELVFADPALGRHLNPVTVRKRYKQARDSVSARPLRFHDLRHTYGSLLAASGVDLVTIKDMMGHSALSTTSRYLHARPATEHAEAFSEIFSSGRT